MGEEASTPGARANQGFGSPGNPDEQRGGGEPDPPAAKGNDMKTPADDGLDPQKLQKTIKSDEEMIPEQQLDEDLSVTGAPPKQDGPVNAPDG